jgi:hypothetical protein
MLILRSGNQQPRMALVDPILPKPGWRGAEPTVFQ